MRTLRTLLSSCLLIIFLASYGQIQAQNEFITTWQTTVANESILIPTVGGETYNYHVDWGDGWQSVNQTGDVSHLYATAGSHTVTITGDLPRISFIANTSNRDKIININQWGQLLGPLWKMLF